MPLWGFLPWGELCHLHVTNLKSKAQKGFFSLYLFEWHQCQHYKTHCQASPSLADSLFRGSQHKLPQIFMAWIPPSQILSLFHLQYEVFVPLFHELLVQWHLIIIHDSLYIQIFPPSYRGGNFPWQKAARPHHFQPESWIMKFYTSWRNWSRRVLQVHLCACVCNALP